jgi:NAD(P)H-dependent nitrite reductase small subunit
MTTMPTTRPTWRTICALDEILPDTGVAALLGDTQVAIFRVGESDEVHALGNCDPFSGANVLARGLIGDLGGVLVVASPVYKQHFSLTNGVCLEDAEVSVPVFPVRVFNGAVQLAQPVAYATDSPPRQRLVMIGNGMAGMRVIEELLRIAPERYDITVFGAEPHGNYNRILLSPVLAGEKTVAEIMLHTPEWYAEAGITLHLGEPVTAIDRRKRIVRSAAGREVGYDRLLIATGSRGNRLPIPGAALPGVIAFRDLQDVNLMHAAAEAGQSAVVIGGGLLGLEAAAGLRAQGMAVTVVHGLDVLMERQLDPYAASLLRRSLEERGIRFVMNAMTVAILGEQHVTGLRFKDGREIPADLVVMAAGIKANIELAKAAGLQCAHGIVVDDTMQSFDPRVYAVGECAQHRNRVYGLVAPLWEQARVCATHLAGNGHLRYQGSLIATRLKVTGIELYSAGELNRVGGSEELRFCDPEAGVYKRLLLRDQRIVGVLLYGDARDANWYQELMVGRVDVSLFRDVLLFGPGHVANGVPTSQPPSSVPTP